MGKKIIKLTESDLVRIIERVIKEEYVYTIDELKKDLDHLFYLTEENKVKEVKNMLKNLVPSYESNSKIVDHFYKQQSNSKNELHSPKIINDENKVIRIKTK